MKNTPTTSPGQWLASTAGFGVTAALGWSLYDAAILSEAKVGFWEAWCVAVTAGVQTALVLLPIGLVCAWMWHRGTLGRRVREHARLEPYHSAALLLCATVSLLILSCATFGATAAFQRLFASEQVRQLAAAGSIPLVAAMLWLLARQTVSPISRLLARLGSGRRALLLAGTLAASLCLGWGYALTEFASDVFEQLAIHAYLPVLVVAAASALGGLLADHRYARRTTMSTALIALPVVLIYGFGEPSKQLRLALEYRESGTGFVFSLSENEQSHSFDAAQRNRGRSAVCRPDAPALVDVGKASPDAPNIIWLTVDALRWDHTSLSGYRRNTTPHLARHAERAAVFEQAYTPATSTRQSFQSLFSGVYPSMLTTPRGPKWGMALPEEQHTVAEFMSRAGYQTTVLSSEDKIFSKEYGGLQGFDVIDMSPLDHRAAKGYAAPHVIDRIIETLHESDSPQYVWTHLTEPHQPYKGGPDPIDYGQEEVDRYDAAIHFVDGELGRLLDAVAQIQHEKPTYIFLSADHGQAFGEHQNRLHGSTVYQEETHVPLVVWGPDIVAARHQTPVSVMDLFPTTLDVADLKVPEAICGQSLKAALEHREFSRAPVYFEQVPDHSRAYFAVGFVNGRYKTIVQPAADAIELFDLADDPGETVDLAASKPDLLAEQLEALRSYWRERGMDPSDYGVGDKR